MTQTLPAFHTRNYRLRAHEFTGYSITELPGIHTRKSAHLPVSHTRIPSLHPRIYWIFSGLTVLKTQIKNSTTYLLMLFLVVRRLIYEQSS